MVWCDAPPDSRCMGPDTLPDSRKMKPLTTNAGNWNHSEIDPSCWRLLATLERLQCTEHSCLRIRVGIQDFQLEWWSFNHHHALLVQYILQLWVFFQLELIRDYASFGFRRIIFSRFKQNINVHFWFSSIKAIFFSSLLFRWQLLQYLNIPHVM